MVLMLNVVEVLCLHMFGGKALMLKALGFFFPIFQPYGCKKWFAAIKHRNF